MSEHSEQSVRICIEYIEDRLKTAAYCGNTRVEVNVWELAVLLGEVLRVRKAEAKP